MENPQIVKVLFFSAALTLSISVYAQEAEEESTESAVEDEILVTGSRLFLGDPTVRGLVITADEIAARGFSSAEDIIRSIPHNLSSINSATNLAIDGVLDTNLGALGLGISSANLRGLGSANTLVLLNGRRMAGAAGVQEFFANLRDFPVGAIDRVEIMMDGGSALYGSDAIAGVINIITKKDFTGARMAASYENSSSAAHQTRLNGYGGVRWGAGNATLAFSYRESDPVNNRKAGWTTRDYSARYGGDARYDFRNAIWARSGRVGFSPYGQNLTLPLSHDGTNAQPEDFMPITPAHYVDYVVEDAAGSTEDMSMTLNVTQALFEKLVLEGELHWTRADTKREVGTLSGGSTLVPESNAFNNFGRDVWVGYTPWMEVENGLIPPIHQTNSSEQLRYVMEANYQIAERLELRLGYVRSESDGDGVQWNFGSNRFSRSITDSAQLARIDEVLSSSDPNVAVNLFGDGSAQNPGVAELLIPVGNARDKTISRSVDVLLRGELFRLPGGRMGFTIGGEQRDDWLEDDLPDFGLVQSLGVAQPTRALKAAFAELSFPLVGADNARRGIESLELNFKMRYDDYSTEGAFGTTVPGDRSSPPNIIEASFDNLSPRYGLAWKPTPGILVRGSYGGSFRAPIFGQLFGTFRRDRVFSNFVYDPLAEGFPFVPAIQSISSNPDLEPETSDNLDLSVVFTPDWGGGLRLEVAYSHIDYQDRIAHSGQLGQLLPPQVYGNLPEFFVRDENGVLIESFSKSINISKRVSETMDLSISRSWQTRWGTIFGEIFHHQVLALYDQAVADAPKASFVNRSVGVLRSSTRANLHWKYRNMDFEVWITRTPGYVNNDFENSFRDLPNEEVDAYTTVDLSGQYVFDGGLSIRAGGRNVFHDSFPYMLSQSGQPFDPRRVNARGRVLFLELSYELKLQR